MNERQLKAMARGMYNSTGARITPETRGCARTVNELLAAGFRGSEPPEQYVQYWNRKDRHEETPTAIHLEEIEVFMAEQRRINRQVKAMLMKLDTEHVLFWNHRPKTSGE